ncbi:hypothetical protein BD410DRAFT_781599 [Rickenella mellea]|uniref:Uncharacterized protein n=1 Tax=Rickenella mellea TaxID=50990 RepID=A0A4Y7QKE5_9AGAM|nr:hypothetical protein BD410DRAFT_781599 [Rickenella mellea]
MTSPLNILLKPLADAVKECGKNAPWCTGTCNVAPEDLKLYFDYGTDIRSIHFANATEAQLDELAKACQPATFGANQEDVLDENYRKAGKMDLNHFSINFSPERIGLAMEVKFRLLGLDADERNIRLEPYKLNVYGSLVVVLPTAHEGGALVLRHDNKELIFDSGKEFDSKPPGTIAFVAFYSDVEHEVQQVNSGHRVTITYNLYFADEKAVVSAPTTVTPAVDQFSASLKTLLANPEFFSNGGLLGFELKHQYPLSSDGRGDFNLNDLLTCLKGEDAVILRACKDHGLIASLKIIYDANRGWLVMCDKPSGGFNYQVEDVVEELVDSRDGVSIWVPEGYIGYYPDRVVNTWRKTVKWVTPMKSMTSHTSHYIAYGNEASMGYLYGQVSLIVEVGVPGQRQDPSTIVPFDLEEDLADAYEPTDIP